MILYTLFIVGIENTDKTHEIQFHLAHFAPREHKYYWPHSMFKIASFSHLSN
jgi:hypothetical protein